MAKRWRKVICSFILSPLTAGHPRILEICRKKLQQLRHLELFQNRNERKSTKKHDFGPIEAHIDVKVCQLLADYCLGCLSDTCTRDLPEKITTIKKPCTISLLSVEV